MSSRVDSWGSTTLVFLTVLSHYLPGERFVKPMERLGWHSTALICRSLRFSGLCVTLTFLRLNIALELAKHNPVYEDIASKFFEVSYRTSEATQLLILR